MHLFNQLLNRFEARKLTGMILIDLLKVCDTLAHGIPLKKLEYIGFTPETVAWFELLEKTKSYGKPCQSLLLRTTSKLNYSLLGPILL